LVIRIIAVIMGILALLMTYRVDWLLKNIFHMDDPTPQQRLRVKYIALGVAIASFVMVMAADKF